VVYNEAASEFCSGVNFDAGEKPGNLRYAPREKTEIVTIEKMRQAMADYRMNTGIKQQNL